MSEHKPTLVRSFIDRQFECSCGFRTRVADSLNVSIFDIEEEFRQHAGEQEQATIAELRGLLTVARGYIGPITLYDREVLARIDAALEVGGGADGAA